MDLDIQEDTLHFALSGDMTCEIVEQVRSHLASALSAHAGIRSVRIDLSKLVSFEASALSLLAGIWSECEQRKGTLLLLDTPTPLRRPLDLCRFPLSPPPSPTPVPHRGASHA